jgi:hypothetical protein
VTISLVTSLGLSIWYSRLWLPSERFFFIILCLEFLLISGNIFRFWLESKKKTYVHLWKHLNGAALRNWDSVFCGALASIEKVVDDLHINEHDRQKVCCYGMEDFLYGNNGVGEVLTVHMLHTWGHFITCYNYVHFSITSVIKGRSNCQALPSPAHHIIPSSCVKNTAIQNTAQKPVFLHTAPVPRISLPLTHVLGNSTTHETYALSRLDPLEDWIFRHQPVLLNINT